MLVGNATQLIPGTERLLIGSLGRSQFKARTQAFTTGSEPAVLGSVTLPSFQKRTNNAQADVHIYSASGVDPGARLHTLTRPDFSSLGTGVGAVTFTAPAGETITLAANTTYLVYVESVQGEVGLLHTKDDDEDPSSDEGWSIADRCRVIHSAALPNEGCQSTNGLTAALVMVLNSPLEAGKPLVSITGSQAVEGSGVQFTVSLSSALGEAVTVEYSTADDSATTADSDYTGVSAATLTFAANETEKTVTITTTADSVDEDDETFNVELSSPSENAQLGFVTAASGLIINNDQTTQTDGTLSSITLTGSDGNAVALTPTFDKYSFLYTATADSEIDSLTGVVTPSTSGTVDSILYVGGDEDTNTAAYDAVWPLVPGDNLVKFMVTSPDGSRTKIYKIHVDKAASTDATLGALAFVDNNGAAITLSPAFDSATTSYTATVGAAATSVTLTGMTSFSGATMSNTHGPDTMSGVATEAAWTGESEIGITVTAEDGTTTQYYSVLATRNLEVSFGSATYTVDEGEMVEVSVELNGDPGQQVSVDLLATGSGATAADFGSVPSNVIFAAGEVARTFQFRARTDSETDDGETVTFSMNMLTAGLVKGSPDETVITINDIDDTDVPAVMVSFEHATYVVDEGESVDVKVKLSADPERTVVIPISRSEANIGSGDYSGVPMSVSFASGETEKIISFIATEDTENDDGESLLLGFGPLPLPDSVSLGTYSQSTVSITDDDVPAVTVSFEEASYTVAESDDTTTSGVEEHKVTVKVKLSADPERKVIIPIGELRLGGAAPEDYSGVPGDVTFESGDTEMSFTFTALHDTVDDDGEQLRLTLAPLPAGVTGAAPYSAVFSITDDDDPQVEVTISSSVTTVAEGGTATITVSLDKDPEREVIVLITRVNLGGASAVDDYSGVPDDVTFADGGPTTQSFTFVAADDTVDDDDEGVTIGFGTLPASVSAGTSNEITISIDDNDVPEVTVSFEKSLYTVAESDDTTTSGVEEHKVAVKVILSADPERNLTIPLSPEGLGDISSADYSGIPANISFSTDDTNKTEKTFTFTATHDDADDDGEGVKITFDTDNLPDRVSVGGTDETIISITDDDFPSIKVNFERGSYSVAESDDTTPRV